MKRFFRIIAISIFPILILLVIVSQNDQNSFEYYSSLSNEELNSLPKYDRPDLAQIQNFEMTKDPNLGYPPNEKLLSIYDEMKSFNSSARSADPSSSWRERGPNNVGGRTRGIMFDPNDPSSKKVWAAGVGGGLWYNSDITNANSSWNVVNDFFGNIAITSIAYDPSNTQVMYFGTGEGWFNADATRGNGIWKSIDGGESWEQLASTANNSEFQYVQKVVVTNEGTILAATRENGGIYRSDDVGATWTRVLTQSRGADLEVNNDVIYASTGIFNQGLVYRSEDDGLTWETITPISGSDRIDIAVHPNHPNVVYALCSSGTLVNGIFKSIDKGDNWETMTIPSYRNTNCSASTSDFARGQAWYDLIIAVSPSDQDEVVVGGIDLHKTEDGGDSWGLISYWTGACDDYVHADQHNFIFRPGFPNQAIAANDGGISYTPNFNKPLDEGGPDFVSRNFNYNVTQFYACAMENEIGSDYFLAGAQDNGSQQFFNAGMNATNEITGGDGAFCFIDQDDSNIQITSYVYNSYRITKDGWATRQNIEGDLGRFINPTDYNSNSNMLYAAGNADQIIRYNVNNGNISAEVISLSLSGQSISAVKVSDYDNDVVFVGTSDGDIFRINGATGTNLTATNIGTDDLPTNIYISSIDIGASNSELLITASNFGVESVFFTVDEGASWISKEGDLQDIPIRWAIFNPSNREEVLLATELGVWMTSAFSDTDPTWVSANFGLANVRCDMLKYRTSDGLVAVATHGRGLYTSDIFATVSYAKFITADVAYVGQNVSFVNQSILSTNYSWDFGNGDTSSEENPTYNFSTAGTYDVVLKINNDELKTFTKTVAVLPSFSTSYELSDGGDFESNASHFYSVSVAGGTPFELGSSSIDGKSGVSSGANAWVTGIEVETYKANGLSYLYTPQFDFSISGDYSLEFYTNYMIEDEWDGFIVEYSLDNANSWTKLGDFLDVDNWYNQEAISTAVVFRGGEPIFSGDTGNEFLKKKIVFNDLSASEKVSFRFSFRTDPGSEEAGVAIDDFQLIIPASTAPNVAFASSTNVSCKNEFVTFENASTGNISSYSWNFGEGAIPANATGFGPHEVKYTTNGEKTIELSIDSPDGAFSTSQNITINNLPEELSFDETEFIVCEGESIIIPFTSPESNITYTLIDQSTDVAIVDPVISDGTDFDFSLNDLDVGDYSFSVTASLNGSCEITMATFFSLEIQPNPLAEITRVDLKELRSSFGDEYEWFLNGDAISGATSQNLSIDEPGTYSVTVTEGICATSSGDFEVISVLGFDENLILEVYPNPVVDYLNLILDSENTSFLKIHSFSGATVVEQKVDGSKAYLDLSNLKSGLYYLTIRTELKTQNVKFLKK